MDYFFDARFWIGTLLTVATIGILITNSRMKAKGLLIAFVAIAWLADAGFYFPGLFRRADVLSSEGFASLMLVCGPVFNLLALAGSLALMVYAIGLRSPEAATKAVIAAPAPEIPDGNLASRGIRLGAHLVDLAVYFGAILPGGIAMFALRAYRDAPVAGLLVSALGALACAAFQIFLLCSKGQTIGKRLLGIRIARLDDGTNPGFLGAVLLRGFVPGMISAVPLVGALFSLVDVLCIFREDRRCVHDLLAGTRVVTA